jgi:hypothetical protein
MSTNNIYMASTVPAEGRSLDFSALRGELSPYAAPPLLIWSQVVISHLLRSPESREGT